MSQSPTDTPGTTPGGTGGATPPAVPQLPESRPEAQPGQRPTLWLHNGSTMYLVVSGSSRAFYYDSPRPGMLEAGAQRGSLLFTGEAVGNSYEGTAYIFSSRCGQFPYRVSGPILEGGRRVVMTGQAPRVNAACQIAGYLSDTLDFTLVDR